MPRLRQVPRAEAPPEINDHYDLVFGKGRDPVVEPGTATGTPGNWHTIWAQAPKILKAFQAFGYRDATVDMKLTELAIMRTAYLRRSQFVYSQHGKGARTAGVSEEKIEAIPYWSSAACYDDAERHVLTFIDALIGEDGRMPDKVVENLKTHMTEVQILELAYLAKSFDLHATLCVAFRLEYDDVPERIVEIPRPPTPRAQNWLDPSSWNT